MNPKKIKYYKYSLNNKNSISFSYIKFLLSLFFFPKNDGVLVIFSFLLLRPSKSSGALKKDPTFGFLTFGYALKKWALGRACMEKVSCIYCSSSKAKHDVFSAALLNGSRKSNYLEHLVHLSQE